jgi:hypothetical protein
MIAPDISEIYTSYNKTFFVAGANFTSGSTVFIYWTYAPVGGTPVKNPPPNAGSIDVHSGGTFTINCYCDSLIPGATGTLTVEAQDSSGLKASKKTSIPIPP